MAQRHSLLAIADSLHSARLATYLAESRNDVGAALELYRWNLRLASAFQEILSVTEIVLRNSIDRALGQWNTQQLQRVGDGFHGPEWLLDPARPLRALTDNARKTADRNAKNARAARWPSHPRKLAAITHDDMLAQLTFGVFAKLLPTTDTTDSNYVARRVLWQEALVGAFPNAHSDPDGVVVSDRVRRLHALRNRVSHMEPLLTVNIAARHTDALQVVALINPSARDWCASISRVRAVAREDPRLT